MKAIHIEARALIRRINRGEAPRRLLTTRGKPKVDTKRRYWIVDGKDNPVEEVALERWSRTHGYLKRWETLAPEK